MSWERLEAAATADPEGATIRLREQLFEFANRNKSFMRGDLDLHSIALGGAERYYPLINEQNPDMRHAYSFTACRERPARIESDIITGYRKNVTHFTIDLSFILANTVLPPDQETDTLVRSDRTTPEGTSPVDYVQNIHIGLSSNENILRVCESFSYTMECTGVLKAGCSCPVIHPDKEWWNSSEDKDPTQVAGINSASAAIATQRLAPSVIELFEYLEQDTAKDTASAKAADLMLAFRSLDLIRQSLDELTA